jgi:hypothetical protein
MRGVLVDEKNANNSKLIGNRIIILCLMRGVILDENTAHISS